MAKAACAGQGHRRHRHHQPARDHDRVGPRDGQADPQRHRLAGPPHRGRLRARCAPRRPRGRWSRTKTGLLLDPYFSATKIAWLLDHVDGARAAAEQGRLAFGTIDSFLLWRLTGGAVHATDATNASRTHAVRHRAAAAGTRICADCSNIPEELLPEVRDCADDFGTVMPELFGGAIRILGMAGDQQAATIGQGCFTPGMMKSTYGTGCFALLNTGDRAGAVAPPAAHHHRLSD